MVIAPKRIARGEMELHWMLFGSSSWRPSSWKMISRFLSHHKSCGRQENRRISHKSRNRRYQLAVFGLAAFGDYCEFETQYSLSTPEAIDQFDNAKISGTVHFCEIEMRIARAITKSQSHERRPGIARHVAGNGKSNVDLEVSLDPKCHR
jgi:hypothetical protein